MLLTGTAAPKPVTVATIVAPASRSTDSSMTTRRSTGVAVPATRSKVNGRRRSTMPPPAASGAARRAESR